MFIGDVPSNELPGFLNVAIHPSVITCGLGAAAACASALALRVASKSQRGRPQPLFTAEGQRAPLVVLLAALAVWLGTEASRAHAPGATWNADAEAVAGFFMAVAPVAALATALSVAKRAPAWMVLVLLLLPLVPLTLASEAGLELPEGLGGALLPAGPASYAALCGLLAVGTVLAVYRRKWRARRLEALTLLAGLAVPMVSALVNARLGMPVSETASVAAVGSVVLLGWLLEVDRSTRLLLDAKVSFADLMADTVLIVDDRHLVIAATPMAREVLGLPEDMGLLPGGGARLPAQLAAHLKADSDSGGEFTVTTPMGKRHFEVSVAPIRANRARSVALREVTSSREIEARLTRLAHYDGLTGLANRRRFTEVLEAAMTEAARNGTQLALLYFDLDRFKEINDNLGHAAGDTLLRAIANRLRQELRDPRVQPVAHEIARIGGDEFAILLTDLAGPDDDQIGAERTLKAICKPFWIEDQDVVNRASIGIARFPRDAENAGTLIHRADAALYAAKARGGNCYERFRPEQAEAARRSAEIRQRLGPAIAAGELSLHYQPKFDLRSRDLVGCEALIRWDSPHLGRVPPAVFIPLAEGTPLMTDITQFVIRTACGQLARWRQAGLDVVPVAVNVAGSELARPDFVHSIASALTRHGLHPGLLEIEITERSFIDDVQVVSEALRELRRIGVLISLDDFGTGYSTISCLTTLPLDIVKLDRSFVRDMKDDAVAHEVIRGMVSMAHSLGLAVVAEGIDDEDYAETLAGLGCDHGQGFALGAPVPAEAFADGRWDTLPAGSDRAAGASASVDLSDDDLPSFTDQELPMLADLGPTDAEAARYALLLDDESGSLAPLGLRLNRLGLLTLYTRFPEEAVLLAQREGARIRAVVVSPETPLEPLAGILSGLSLEVGEVRVAVIGARPDDERRALLRQAGTEWALWSPFEDVDLRFVVNSAMTLPWEIARRSTPRAPADLVVSVAGRDSSEIGKLSSLSEGGAFIEIEGLSSPGTSLGVGFTLGDVTIEAEAKVAFISTRSHSWAPCYPRGVGVSFGRLGPEARAAISRYVKERLSRYVP